MIMNLTITPEKCYHTTLWNAEFIHLIKVTSFSWKNGWVCKQPVIMLYGNSHFRQTTSQDHGNQLDLGQ